MRYKNTAIHDLASLFGVKPLRLLRKKHPCEVHVCRSKLNARIHTNENIGDGCFSVRICSTCAMIIGVRSGQDMPQDAGELLNVYWLEVNMRGAIKPPRRRKLPRRSNA